MAPQSNSKSSRATSKATNVNSGTPPANSKSNDNNISTERLLEIIASSKQQASTAENDKKTSKRASGKIAKAEDWKAEKQWHAELLAQLQGHFGKGPMKKYVDSMRKRSIFFEYEEKLLSDVLTKYPHDNKESRTHRPIQYPMAIAIVFMKHRKDHMTGFNNNEIKLDFTDKQIRDKLDHMWKDKSDLENQNQQPTSTARLQMRMIAETTEENMENGIPDVSFNAVVVMKDDMAPQEELSIDEPMEIEEEEDLTDTNDAMDTDVNDDEPMEDEEKENKIITNSSIVVGIDKEEPKDINTPHAENVIGQDQKSKDLMNHLRNRFEQWGKTQEDNWKQEKQTKIHEKRRQMQEFLQGDWINASSPTELLGCIHHHLVKFSETERNELLAIMENLGLCCGNHQFTTRQPLKCSGSTISKECSIQPLQQYKTFDSDQQTFNYCLDHLQKREPKRKSKAVGPSAASWKFCNVETLEKCGTCGDYYHNSCRRAGLLEERNCECGKQDEEFVSPLTLPETEESKFIEKKVNDEEILVRCFSTKSMNDQLEGDDEEEKKIKKMRKIILDFFSKYGKNFNLPYENKLILAFKKTKKNYILFFAMMSREYGSNAPSSKAGQISVDYVDSVQFLKKSERSGVYHKIMNSYLEFSGKRGFSTATFWACPPSEGEQYLFDSRPMQQYAINLSQLIRFYENMLKDAGNTTTRVEHILPNAGLPPTGIIENAISNNSKSFTIISKTIEKVNKVPNAEFEKLLKKVAEKEGTNDIFNLKLKSSAEKIVPNNPANVSEIAESSDNFKVIQETENMEFGVLSRNVVSTSKMVKHLRRSLVRK